MAAVIYKPASESAAKKRVRVSAVRTGEFGSVVALEARGIRPSGVRAPSLVGARAGSGVGSLAPDLSHELLSALDNGVPIRSALRLLGLLAGVVFVAYLLPTLLISGNVQIDELALALLGACLWGCLVLFGVSYYRRRQARSTLIHSFYRSIKPLIELQESLNSFLGAFDQRTRNYFHSASSEKVNHYFRLRQIDQGIVALLRDVRHYAGQGTAEAAEHARWLLRQPFYIPERLFQDKSEMVQVPVHALPQIVHQLRHELDQSVVALDKEIAQWRRAPLEDLKRASNW